jgi:transcription antitermination factor NusG
MSLDWHIWVIKQGNFSSIEFFLQNDVPEVKEIFFPTVLKECRIKDKLYKKRVPLYSGYLFLLYEDAENKLFYKIRSNPFVTNYVGICSQKTIDEMRCNEQWCVLNKKVEVGNEVEVVSGPLQKCKGSVSSINGNRVTIKVNMFDRSLDYTLSSEDLEVINT